MHIEMKQYHLSKTVLQKAQITHCKISYSKGAARSQEALRILRNSSPEVPWKGKAEFLLGFCLRMKLSGDPERYRAAIIELALKAWDKNLLNVLLGVRTRTEPTLRRGRRGGRRKSWRGWIGTREQKEKSMTSHYSDLWHLGEGWQTYGGELQTKWGWT